MRRILHLAQSMTPGDLIRLSVFLTCIVAIYAIAIRYASLSLRWWKQGYQPPIPVSCVRALFLALALLGILFLAYARLVEPFWLEIKHISISSKRIPPGTSLRIVHLSDLHSGAWAPLEDRIPSLVAAQKPDLIVFTGDAVVKARGVPLAQHLFAALSKIAPMYAVPGNQDYRFRNEAFAVNGLHTLEQNVAELELRGNRVSILGAAWDHETSIPSLLSSASQNSFHLLLYHSPDEIENIALENVDLYCAGHTHGGQVRLPWYGAVITMSKLGKKYESGLYHVGNTYLYVNRGLGMDSPRVRFLARPEITVIDVQPSP